MKWPARSVYYLVSGLGDISHSDYNEICKINVGSQYFIFYLRLNTDLKRIMNFDCFAFLKLNLNTCVDLFVYVLKRVDNVLPLSLTTNIALFFFPFKKNFVSILHVFSTYWCTSISRGNALPTSGMHLTCHLFCLFLPRPFAFIDMRRLQLLLFL